MAQTVLRGKKLSMSEVAEFFGVKSPTIRKWSEEGMPYLKRGGKGIEWEFDSAAIIDFVIERELKRKGVGGEKGNDRSSLTHRKATAETELREIELARKSAEVIPTGWFIDLIGIMCDQVNGKLSALANRIAPLVAVETDVTKCHRIIERAVNDARSSLVAPAEQDLVDAALRGDTVRGVARQVQANT